MCVSVSVSVSVSSLQSYKLLEPMFYMIPTFYELLRESF